MPVLGKEDTMNEPEVNFVKAEDSDLEAYLELALLSENPEVMEALEEASEEDEKPNIAA